MNHARLVTEFSQALAEIGEVLPRTELNAKLYATDQMKTAVANLYARILLFLKQAIKWYSFGPAGRAISALFKPFELSYKSTIDEIRHCADSIEELAAATARAEIRDIHVLLQRQSQRLDSMQQNFDVAVAEISALVSTNLDIATS